MAKLDLLSILSRPVAFHRVLADLTGNVLSALMLSQAVYWQRVADAGGSNSPLAGRWHKTRGDWTDETALTRREQETARKRLRELADEHGRRLWTECEHGMPSRLFYRVDVDVLHALLCALADERRAADQHVGRNPPNKKGANEPTCRAESAQQEGRNPPNCLYRTETTTETTAEEVEVLQRGVQGGGDTAPPAFAPQAAPTVPKTQPTKSAPEAAEHPSSTPGSQRPAKPPPAASQRAARGIAGCELLLPLGVEPRIAEDWLAIRRARRLPLTPTAVAALQREAAAAGVSVADAVREAVERGWAGFRAAWLVRERSPPAQAVETFRERDARLARERIEQFAPGLAERAPAGRDTIDAPTPPTTLLLQ